MPDVLTGESLELQTLLADPLTVIVAHLSKHAIVDDGNPLELSDIVECDFLGYAPVPLTEWTVPQADMDQLGEAISGPIEFAAAGLIAPQEAYALYLTASWQGGPVRIWRVYPILPPFTFDLPNRTMRRQVRIRALDDSSPPPD